MWYEDLALLVAVSAALFLLRRLRVSFGLILALGLLAYLIAIFLNRLGVTEIANLLASAFVFLFVGVFVFDLIERARAVNSPISVGSTENKGG